MKKGTIRTIVGSILVILQLISFAGNAKTGNTIPLSFESSAQLAYNVIFLLSYCFVGIVGMILLISGTVALCRSASGDSDEDFHAPTRQAEQSKHRRKHFRFPKHGAVIICMSLVILMLVGVVALQQCLHENEIRNLNAQIEDLNVTVGYQSDTISKMKYTLSVYDMFVVFVPDNGGSMYHKLDCEDCGLFTFSPYSAERAEIMGFLPCPKCCE